jgi:hypothetical protein
LRLTSPFPQPKQATIVKTKTQHGFRSNIQ